MDNIDTIKIGNEEYKTIHCEVEQNKLNFYPENPRVYSLLNSDNITPSQTEIENLMCSMEHVKALKESIKNNGGLIDPLIIRNGDYVVLEGNSRLAAYRILHKQDPFKWNKVKVTILPEDIPDSAIFALIGNYHISGKKDWDPYEQAGYLYRTIKRTGKTQQELANELSIKISEVRRLLKIYEYMIKVDDNDSAKWSQYEEFLKNAAIQKTIKNNRSLETKIVKDIKEDNFNMAIDIRKIGEICRVDDKDSKKILKEYVNGNVDAYEAHDIIEDTGKLDNIYSSISSFRKKITSENIKNKVLHDENKQKIAYELKKIKLASDSLVKAIEGSE